MAKQARTDLTTAFYVYILSNKTGSVLYTGVTSNLSRRVYEHEEKFIPSFTSKYKVNCLVYYEVFDDPVGAISREKQIESGSRAKKLALINAVNPDWSDLADEL